MGESKFRWRNREIREHVDVLDGKRSPTMVLYNATYLNGMFKQWMKGNIWIYNDRIVYVGTKSPEYLDDKCEKVDCKGLLLVPGYIEPHAHPFQLYNPLTFSQYASKFGTTVLINDNLPLFLYLQKKKAFSIMEKLRNLPTTMYWWARLDSQSEMVNEEVVFSNSLVKSWLDHEMVVQAGELTGWPNLLDGDDLKLHWVQEAKRLNKKVEGHFPGASEKTLAKLKLLGADADHEAINGEEVIRRLMLGYMVTLRHSSIRPDLPEILDDLKKYGLTNFDNFMLTTDGSVPSFYEQGFIDYLIKICIEKGVPAIDAYLMATLNPAKHFNMIHLHGLIATGRVANINFIKDENNPTPVSVLAKGKWVKKDGQTIDHYYQRQLEDIGIEPLKLNWNITNDDLQFSMPFGISLENTVITKPYSITIDVHRDELDENIDECFLMAIDREGERRINTLLKGFATDLGGLASSFSYTGDILIIGKRKSEMLKAFHRLKEIGGGIVIVKNDNIVLELPLTYLGIVSDLPFEELIQKEKEFKQIMVESGYKFRDPVNTLLFFTSTHVPYLRLTPRGLFDVIQKNVLFPSIMR